MHVSTHSRLKAAGFGDVRHVAGGQVSTHSRLKAAGHNQSLPIVENNVSTHSRLKAAGSSLKSLAPSGFAALISLNS